MKYEGAILAGGTGTRIRPLSLTIPKPMLPVLNAPLIERQLKSMESAGIEKVFVVVGSLDGMIADYLKSRRGAEIELVEQASPQGIAHAASLLEGRIRAPFFLFLADIFYTDLNLGAMMSLKQKAGCDGVVAVNREPNAGYIRRNFTVYLDGDSRITGVREKPEKVDTDLKGCGIYLFGAGLFEAIRRTPKNGKRGELELTSSIQVMIDSGASILAGEGVRGDVNITDPVDLLVSNLRALENAGKDSLVGRNASIHPGARIDKSVIGNDVTIREPICIRECVVMDGVCYEDTEDIERAVVMKDFILQDRGPGRGRAG